MSQPTITSADIGKVVSFSVYPVSLLGTGFQRVTILGILDYESAQQYINPAVMSVNVYPSLPQGTITDYTKYQYLKVKLANDTNTCVAIEWIDTSTYVVHHGVNITFTLNDAVASDVDKVRMILAANGYSNVKFSMT